MLHYDTQEYATKQYTYVGRCNSVPATREALYRSRRSITDAKQNLPGHLFSPRGAVIYGVVQTSARSIRKFTRGKTGVYVASKILVFFHPLEEDVAVTSKSNNRMSRITTAQHHHLASRRLEGDSEPVVVPRGWTADPVKIKPGQPRLPRNRRTQPHAAPHGPCPRRPLFRATRI